MSSGDERKKIARPAAATVLLGVFFTFASAAQAAKNTDMQLYEIKGTYKDGKALWDSNRDTHHKFHLKAEHDPAYMELFAQSPYGLKDTKNQFAASLTFHCRKKKLGVLFTETCDPVVTLLYGGTGYSKGREVSACALTKTNVNGDDFDCSANLVCPPGAIPIAVAIVAKVDMKPTPRQYANFEITDVKLNGFDNDFKVINNVIKTADRKMVDPGTTDAHTGNRS